MYPLFKKLKILQYTFSGERSISPMKQRATRRREKSASSAVQGGSFTKKIELPADEKKAV
jgi:hypothetical protein